MGGLPTLESFVRQVPAPPELPSGWLGRRWQLADQGHLCRDVGASGRAIYGQEGIRVS